MVHQPCLLFNAQTFGRATQEYFRNTPVDDPLLDTGCVQALISALLAVACLLNAPIAFLEFLVIIPWTGTTR